MRTRLRQSCLFAGVLIALPLLGGWSPLHADYISDQNMPALRVEAPVFFPPGQQDCLPVLGSTQIETRRDTPQHEGSGIQPSDILLKLRGDQSHRSWDGPERAFPARQTDGSRPFPNQNESPPPPERVPTTPPEGLGTTGGQPSDSSGGHPVGLVSTLEFRLPETVAGFVLHYLILPPASPAADLFRPPRAPA